MHICKLLSAFFCAALFSVLAGCATAPLPGIADTALQAKPAELLGDARRELAAAGVRINENSANALVLSETIGENISSFAADGAPSQYTVHYRLAFSFNGKQRVVELSETVDYAAGLHHAGRRQRESVARSLRQSAIAEMLNIVGGGL